MVLDLWPSERPDSLEGRELLFKSSAKALMGVMRVLALLPDAVVGAVRLVAEVLDTILAKSLSRSLRPCWPYEEVRFAKDRLVVSIVTFEAEFGLILPVILLLLLGPDTGGSTRLFAPMSARLGEAAAASTML